jgi:hypothetical protein
MIGNKPIQVMFLMKAFIAFHRWILDGEHNFSPSSPKAHVTTALGITYDSYCQYLSESPYDVSRTGGGTLSTPTH